MYLYARLMQQCLILTPYRASFLCVVPGRARLQTCDVGPAGVGIHVSDEADPTIIDCRWVLRVAGRRAGGRVFYISYIVHLIGGCLSRTSTTNNQPYVSGEADLAIIVAGGRRRGGRAGGRP